MTVPKKHPILIFQIHYDKSQPQQSFPQLVSYLKLLLDLSHAYLIQCKSDHLIQNHPNVLALYDNEDAEKNGINKQQTNFKLNYFNCLSSLFTILDCNCCRSCFINIFQ